MLSRHVVVDLLKANGTLEWVKPWLETLDDLTLFALRNELENVDGPKSLKSFVHASDPSCDGPWTIQVQLALRAELDIANRTVTVDRYYGLKTAEMMCVVFKRLNDAGTKLNEWEIAAALFALLKYPLVPVLRDTAVDYLRESRTLPLDFAASHQSDASFSLHEYISAFCLTLWGENAASLGSIKRCTPTPDLQVTLVGLSDPVRQDPICGAGRRRPLADAQGASRPPAPLPHRAAGSDGDHDATLHPKDRPTPTADGRGCNPDELLSGRRGRLRPLPRQHDQAREAASPRFVPHAV